MFLATTTAKVANAHKKSKLSESTNSIIGEYFKRESENNSVEKHFMMKHKHQVDNKRKDVQCQSHLLPMGAPRKLPQQTTPPGQYFS
jgi:hypothetical protein